MRMQRPEIRRNPARMGGEMQPDKCMPASELGYIRGKSILPG
jgi:hypothetical protein